MGAGVVNKKCDEEQKRAEAAAKRAQKAKEAKAKKNSAQDVLMPKDLEDYKGARKKLRHAVKAVVKANSDTLAEKIVGKAQDGDVRGAEMMLSLIEKMKPGKEAKKKKREGPSWAELLASEPEWDEAEDGTLKPAAAQSAKEAAGQKMA